MFSLFPQLILFSWVIFNVGGISIEDARRKFGQNPCIKGYIITKEKNSNIFTNDNSGTNQVYHSLVDVISDKEAKSVLSKLHELADFNNLEYKYTLTKEEGLPHDKTFTVTLTLGEEKYEGVGKSLKDAQRHAASKALQNTILQQPKSEKETDPLTPTVLLNNVGTKLGIAINYEFVPLIPDSSVKENLKSKKSYSQLLNDSINDQAHVKQPEIDETKGPFNVKVTVGNDEYYGSGYSKQEAKHKAATNALIGLKNSIHQTPCFLDSTSAACKNFKESQKHPVSQVHEAAQIRNMDVSFEVTEETGKSHQKEFTIQCTLGKFLTLGNGKSKREAKKDAAEKMLANLPHLPEISLEKEFNSLNKKGKKKKKRKNKIGRTTEETSLFGDIINTIFGEEALMPDENEIKSEPNNNQQRHTGKDTHSSSKSNQKSNNGNEQSLKTAQSHLLELSNKKKFEINFYDLGEKDGSSFSLLSLEINPTHLCLGEGINSKSSREMASKFGLRLLYKLGFVEDFKVLPYLEEEGECPFESTSVVVDVDSVKSK
ncbi:double-stranded RNA-binding protein Staufen homolog 2 isoform X2 [Aethina tumida]|uniref:double-stranded RNA-binding protein Staufen homolog 2 isoform X2 n=1 Tax=Aethina tumida TaxID=116153 RepID=UPI002148510E|nr:double-stranded RNA-binding protein Staufen homolog 2 isoform X2 [Aethina tumida]